MKMKVAVTVFVGALLGLFVLLHANRSGSEPEECANAGMGVLKEDAEEGFRSGGYDENEDDDEASGETDDGVAIRDSIFEICKPAPLYGVSEIILKKKAYIVSYNKDTKIPNWVAWHLTQDHTDGPIERRNMFYADDAVPEPKATVEDYKGSGWSRGHMCPAGDNKWDAEAMAESFSLINVCPQNAGLNSGLWNSIEMDCRKWARRFQDIYIVCGPVFYKKEHEVIGYNEVFVPEAFFKVVLCLNGNPKGMGFVVKNTAGNKKRDLYYNSIDEVERITGMDFFPALPDDIEEEVESKLDMEEWGRGD